MAWLIITDNIEYTAAPTGWTNMASVDTFAGNADVNNNVINNYSSSALSFVKNPTNASWCSVTLSTDYTYDPNTCAGIIVSAAPNDSNSARECYIYLKNADGEQSNNYIHIILDITGSSGLSGEILHWMRYYPTYAYGGTNEYKQIIVFGTANKLSSLFSTYNSTSIKLSEIYRLVGYDRTCIASAYWTYNSILNVSYIKNGSNTNYASSGVSLGLYYKDGKLITNSNNIPQSTLDRYKIRNPISGTETDILIVVANKNCIFPNFITETGALSTVDYSNTNNIILGAVMALYQEGTGMYSGTNPDDGYAEFIFNFTQTSGFVTVDIPALSTNSESPTITLK